MNKYEELKKEYNKHAFRKALKEQLGDECCNCGEKGVTYHHIVPLKRGGTNRLSNIVPLCPACHKSVHWGKHLDDYNKGHSKLGGRKKKPMPEGCKQIVDDYIFCKIGLQECLDQLPVKNKKKTLRDFGWYRDYLEEMGITACRNNIDIINKKGGIKEDGKKLGYVEYSDGRVIGLYHSLGRGTFAVEERK